MIKSEYLLQELFESSWAIVLITDEKYNIRYSSSSAQALLGVDSLSLAGKNVFEFAPLDKRETWVECLKRAGSSKRSEISLKSLKGEDLYFDVSVTNHIAHHEIQDMVIIMHDITETKRQHILLEKKNEQLDQFIYKTTHDLRSPIHTAMGLLALLEGAKEKERPYFLQMARNSLVKLESLIDEVNNFYRVDKMAILREKINIKNLIEEEISTVKNHPRAKDIQLALKHEGQIELISDPLRLKTIFGNFLTNGVKYSDTKKDSFIQIESFVDDSGLTAVISDNGIGIAEEKIGRIFDVFFRATTEASGTGLGLHIVKDTVERLNGTVGVQSKLGLGTQFRIFIPHSIFYEAEDVISVDGKKAML